MAPPDLFKRVLCRWCRDNGVPCVELPAETQRLTLIMRHADLNYLIQFLQAFPHLVIDTVQRQTDRTLFSLSWLPHGTPSVLEILHDLSWHGLPCLNVTAVLLRAEPAAEAEIFDQIAAPDLGLILLLEQLRTGHVFTPAMRDHLHAAHRQGGLAFTDMLALYFGPQGEKRIDRLSQSVSAGERRALRRRLILSYHLRHLQRHGVMALYLMARDAIRAGWHALDRRLETALVPAAPTVPPEKRS